MKSTGAPTADTPKNFDEVLGKALDDVDLLPEEIPRLDLYMDQILTLFNEILSHNCRHSEDRPLTKTMINNYSKEHLITPVQGKKYSREQMMQLLCVLTLKQALSLTDIRGLLADGQPDVSFEKAYSQALKAKNTIKESLPDLVSKARASFTDLNEKELELATAFVLSATSNYLQRICEGMIDMHGEK